MRRPALLSDPRTMAGVQQGEKQLFEKFWMGTFKAVATPRRESIIVASITSRSRKPLASEEVKNSPSADQEDKKHKKQNGDVENGHAKIRHGRTLSPRQHHSDCLSEAGKVSSSPPPKAKKKKKKSDRKKRKRSQSYSPSPVKKKKKKSSKKRKRNRSSSKKRRHGSSSPKNKRKQVRKHRKHSRGRSRKSHHHHHRHSRSVSSESRSSSFENRPREQSREKKHQLKRKKHKYHHSRSVNKKQKEAPPLSAKNSTYSTKITEEFPLDFPIHPQPFGHSRE